MPNGPPPGPEGRPKALPFGTVPILAKNRHKERLAAIGRKIKSECGAAGVQTGRERPELQFRLSLKIIKPRVAIRNAILGYRRNTRPALAARRSTHLKEIVKIGAKPNLNLEMPGAIGIIAKGNSLIADSPPKKLGSFDRNRIARERNNSAGMDIRVRQIDRECGIVILNDRAQQQRPLTFDAQSVPRQKAHIVEIKSLRTGTNDADVAILIENRKSIAMLQIAQPPLHERPFDLDIVLRQLDLHIHGASSWRELELDVKRPGALAHDRAGWRINLLPG